MQACGLDKYPMNKLKNDVEKMSKKRKAKKVKELKFKEERFCDLHKNDKLITEDVLGACIYIYIYPQVPRA